MLSDLSSVTRRSQVRVLGLERGKLAGQLGDLLVEVLLRLEPVVAGIGVDAEIADHQRRDRVERERGENGAEPLARDHAGTCRGRR